MQGYHFHTRYEGKKYDPYIYEGLYSTLSKINGASYNAIKAEGPPHVHIKSLVVSNQGNGFYTSGTDGRILKGDFSQLTTTTTGFNTLYPSRTIALSKDENYIVNGSDSLHLQVYNIKAKGQPVLITGLTGSANDIEFTANGSSFIVSTSDKKLLLGDHLGATLKPLVTLPQEIKAFNIHPNGKILAGATWTGQVLLVDLSDLSITTVADDKDTRVLSVKFSPDGNTLAYGIDDIINKRGLVKLYNLANRQTRQLSGHRAAVTDVEFSPDGKLLASAGSDKRLLLWLLENPEELPITMDNNNGFIWDIAFTKSSQYLIAACSESEIRVWPTDPALLANQICPRLTRNMTLDEWNKYVGKGEMLQYEPTCVSLLIK
jgi:WD40 repeat protein